MMRVVFVPPIPLSAFPYKAFSVHVYRFPLPLLKNMILYQVERADSVECYIRHESTVRVLSEWLGIPLKPSSSLYTHRRDDFIVVVGLRNPQRGREVGVRSVEELDIAIATAVSRE